MRELPHTVPAPRLIPQPSPPHAHSGEEHGEDVDGSFQEVVAADSNGHGRHEHDIAEAQQQCGEELEAVGESLGIVCAAPAVPACGRGELLSPLQHSQGQGRKPLPSALWRAATGGLVGCTTPGEEGRMPGGFSGRSGHRGSPGHVSPALHSQAAYR